MVVPEGVEDSRVVYSDQNLVHSQVEPEEEVTAVGHDSESQLGERVASVTLIVFKQEKITMFLDRVLGSESVKRNTLNVFCLNLNLSFILIKSFRQLNFQTRLILDSLHMIMQIKQVSLIGSGESPIGNNFHVVEVFHLGEVSVLPVFCFFYL